MPLLVLSHQQARRRGDPYRENPPDDLLSTGRKQSSLTRENRRKTAGNWKTDVKIINQKNALSLDRSCDTNSNSHYQSNLIPRDFSASCKEGKNGYRFLHARKRKS